MLTAAFQFLFLILFLVPAILFLLTQQNTLKVIQPENRLMSPGQVWLQLIPIFNLYWQFVVINRISDSLSRQLYSSGFSFEEQEGFQHANREDRPTHGIGIAYCILFCFSIIPIIGILGTLGGLVCWIIYWVKLSGYKAKVQQLHYSKESNQYH